MEEPLFWFQKHGSFDRLLVQGRWQAAKTARIYINSGLASLAEMNLPLPKLRGFLTVYQNSLDQPLPSLERTLVQGDVERWRENFILWSD